MEGRRSKGGKKHKGVSFMGEFDWMEFMKGGQDLLHSCLPGES